MVLTPAILEPDFDLLGLDVGEDGALSDQLLPPQRAGLGALVVDPLQRLHLLGRVPHVLARVHLPARALLVHHQRHRSRPFALLFSLKGSTERQQKMTGPAEFTKCERPGQSGRLSAVAGSLGRGEPPISFMTIMSRAPSLPHALPPRPKQSSLVLVGNRERERTRDEEDGPCAVGLLSRDANFENFSLCFL